LDETDRRNQIIKTTTDPYWKEWASMIQTTYVIPDPEEIAASFAHILEQVKVDFNLIKSACINAAKADIQECGISHTERWVREDATIHRGHWKDAAALYLKFVDWFKLENPDYKPTTRNMWSREMKKIACVQHAKLGSDDFGRRRQTNEFLVADSSEVVSVSRKEVAADFREFTGVEIPEIMDREPDDDALLSPSRAKLERMREEFAKEM
jgi:hypothetical protein